MGLLFVPKTSYHTAHRTLPTDTVASHPFPNSTLSEQQIGVHNCQPIGGAYEEICPGLCSSFTATAYSFACVGHPANARTNLRTYTRRVSNQDRGNKNRCRPCECRC